MSDVELDKSVPVLLAKMGHYPLHHGSLGAVRSLGRAGVPVYAITERQYTPIGCSRWLTGQFVWPNGRLDHDQLLEGLDTIAASIGGRPVLVPTDDRMAVFIAEHSDHLRSAFRIPDQDAEVARGVADKFRLSRLCAELGVSSPRVLVPADESEVLSFCDESTFPVIAKAIDASVMSRARIRSTSIMETPRDLMDLWELVERHGHGKLMLQEFIPDGEDWIVHGYCNQQGEAIAAYTGVKVRSCPPFAGATSLGVTLRNETLLHHAQLLFRKLGYRGIMDMDWRLDKRDGTYKLLDFNPRVGAQFRLFVDHQGIDVVRAMHLDLTGRSVPPGHPADGRRFMVENYDVAAALGGYRQAGQGMKQWWRSLHGVEELGWSSSDDPLPSVALAGYLAAGLGRRVLPRRAKQLIRHYRKSADSVPDKGSMPVPRSRSLGPRRTADPMAGDQVANAGSRRGGGCST